MEVTKVSSQPITEKVGGVDMMTLLHVGAELVVVAGLAFWIHKKTGSLQEQIDGLTKKIIEQEKIITDQGKLLMQHEQFLREVNARFFSAPNTGVPQQQKNIQKTFPQQKNIQKTFQKTPPPQQNTSQDEDEDNIEDLISDELNDVNSINNRNSECDVDSGNGGSGACLKISNQDSKKK